MKYRYTIIRSSGSAKVYDNKTLSLVFDEVFVEMQVGGTNYDDPKALYRDGNLVVSNGLSQIISRLCYMKRDAMKDVEEAYIKAIDNEMSGREKLCAGNL
jgi:hypothetical protein